MIFSDVGQQSAGCEMMRLPSLARHSHRLTVEARGEKSGFDWPGYKPACKPAYKKDRSMRIYPAQLARMPAVLLWVSGLCFGALLTGCAAGPRNTRATARNTQATDVETGQAGKTEFESYCAACHQYDDQGMGEAPPLDDAPWVVGPQEVLIKIVLHGVRGKMEIAGETYDREMPGLAPILSDEEVASLLSFVRQRFGGLTTPVEAGTVSKIRAEHQDRTDYWSVEELLVGP